MVDGIYSITFRGAVDWGLGLLILQKGTITGADAGGISYDGNYTIENSSINFNAMLTVPPGASLVQGTPVKSISYEIPINALFSEDVLKNGELVTLEMPQGPVNVIFRLLRGFDD